MILIPKHSLDASSQWMQLASLSYVYTQCIKSISTLGQLKSYTDASRDSRYSLIALLDQLGVE